MLRSTSVHFMGTRSASFSTSATLMTSPLQPGRDALKATLDETNQPSIVRILNSRDCRWNAVGFKRPRFTGKPTTVKPFPFGHPRFSTRGGSDAVTDSADTDVEAVGAHAEVRAADMDVEAVGAHAEVGAADMDVEAVGAHAEVGAADMDVEAVGARAEVEAADMDVEAVGARAEVEAADMDVEAVGARAEVEAADMDVEAVGARDDVASMPATRHPRANRSAISASATMLC